MALATASETLLFGPEPSRDPVPFDAPPRFSVRLAGVQAHLLGLEDLLSIVSDRLRDRSPGVLGILSVDSTHAHHFASRRLASRRERAALVSASEAWQVEWLGVLNDARLTKRVARFAGLGWSTVDPSDVLERLLVLAEVHGLRVGFLGSGTAVKEQQQMVARRWPAVDVAFAWTVPCATLDDNQEAEFLAQRVRTEGVDMVILTLPTPQQERFIAEHGRASGARVCVGLGRSSSGSSSPSPWTSRAAAHVRMLRGQ